MINQGVSTTVKQREVRQLLSIEAARQSEIKKCLQANKRAVLLQTLMSVYKTATNEAPKWSTLTVRTRETVLKHSHRGKNKSKADVLGASASILSPTVSKVKASEVTAMKNRIVTRSSSVQAAKSPNVHNLLPQVAAQIALESSKRS